MASLDFTYPALPDMDPCLQAKQINNPKIYKLGPLHSVAFQLS